MTLAVVKPYLSQGLHYLIEQMTIFVNPLPVKRYMESAVLISDHQVERSVKNMEKAIMDSPKCRNWIDMGVMRQDAAKKEEQRKKDQEEPGNQEEGNDDESY